MKKLIIYVLFLLAIVLNLPSCDINHIDNPNTSLDAILSDTTTVTLDRIDSKINDICIIDEYMYLISNDHLYSLCMQNNAVSSYEYYGNAIGAGSDSLYVSSLDNTEIYTISIDDFSISAKYTLQIPQESLIEINRIISIEDSLIIEAIYLNNSGYSESHIYELNTQSQTMVDHTEHFKGNDDYSLLKSMDIKDSSTIVFTSVANTSFTNTILKSYTYDFNEKKLQDSFIFNFNFNSCSYNSLSDSYIFSEDNYCVKKYDRSSDTITALKTFSTDDLGASQYIDKFICSGNFLFILKNSSDCLISLSTKINEESLNILASNSLPLSLDIEKIIEQYEQTYNVPVYITYYDGAVYKDRLRTKLLSHDSDFDIMFINNPFDDNFLSSILEYELFYPLNSDSRIIENFDNMYVGISSMLQHNNNIFGVPFEINISTVLRYNTSSKYSIDFDWNLSDVWELCENLDKSASNNTTVFSSPHIVSRFLVDMIQDQLYAGKLDETVISRTLDTIKYYYDQKLLFCYNMNFEQLLNAESLLEFAPNYFYQYVTMTSDLAFPEYGLVSYPSSNSSYAELNGISIINKYSNNIDRALDFVYIMTSAENIYSTGTSGIYKFILLGKDLEKNSIYSKWDAAELAYLNVLPQIYSNLRFYTYDYIGLMNFVGENLLESFLSGDVSSDSAASEIINYIEYTYFE